MHFCDLRHFAAQLTFEARYQQTVQRIPHTAAQEFSMRMVWADDERIRFGHHRIDIGLHFHTENARAFTAIDGQDAMGRDPGNRLLEREIVFERGLQALPLLLLLGNGSRLGAALLGHHLRQAPVRLRRSGRARRRGDRRLRGSSRRRWRCRLRRFARRRPTCRISRHLRFNNRRSFVAQFSDRRFRRRFSPRQRNVCRRRLRRERLDSRQWFTRERTGVGLRRRRRRDGFG